MQRIEQWLKEIDKARNDFIKLIATGACALDSLDDEFARLYDEEEKLSKKLLSLKSQTDSSQNELADAIKTEIDSTNFELEQYDDVIVRKVIESIKILSSDEIWVVFKGGYEVKAEITN